MKKHIKWVSASISILSVVPLFFIVIYMKDVLRLQDHRNVSPEEVDEILSRTILSAKFLVPTIVMVTFVIIQGILSALILKKEKSVWLKTFAIFNVVMGGMAISNIFLVIDLFVKREGKQRVGFKFVKLGGATVAIGTPLLATAMWITTSGADKPTKVKSVILNTAADHENVIEIFTDGFDPIKTKPLFDNDPTFSDFIALDRMVTGGYLTESSYPQMMGGFERNPWELKSELESGNYKIPNSEKRTEYDAYLHDNFLDSVLNRLGADGINRGYIANPDDLGYFTSYFKHVSGDASKVEARNKVLQSASAQSVKDLSVINWGQAKNETASGIVNTNQNNAAVYKWVSSHVETINDNTQSGSRVFIQDSLTHSPITTDENAKLSFAKVEKSGTSYDTAYKGAHATIHNFIEELKTNNPEAFDNSLIVIYGDHSDHSNTTPSPEDDSNGYEKAHSQVMIKYPHTKASQTHLIDDYTPFFGPDLRYVISDYFTNKATYNVKTAVEQMNAMSSLISTHSKNQFMVVDGNMEEMNASFVKWNIDSTNHANDKLVASTHPFLKSNWANYAQWKDPKNTELRDLYNEMGWK